MVKFTSGEIMLLRESLEEIDDFRVKRCRKFKLADIFLLVLFGLLSGIIIKILHRHFLQCKHFTMDTEKLCYVDSPQDCLIIDKLNKNEYYK